MKKEFTFWIQTDAFRDALCHAMNSKSPSHVPPDTKIEAAIRAQKGFDGEAEFVFSDRRRGRGRFHAVLAFDAECFCLTFRNMADLGLMPDEISKTATA